MLLQQWPKTDLACSFLTRLVPPLRSLVALALSSALCVASNALFYQQSSKGLINALLHIAVGAVAGIAVLLTFLSELSPSDREYLKDTLLRRPKNKDKEE
jgi:hypothetical protein